MFCHACAGRRVWHFDSGPQAEWKMALRYGDLAPAAPGNQPPPLPPALLTEFGQTLGASRDLGGAISSTAPAIRGASGRCLRAPR